MSMDLQEDIPDYEPEDMRPRPSSKKSSKSRSSDDEDVTFGVNGPSIFNSRAGGNIVSGKSFGIFRYQAAHNMS